MSGALFYFVNSISWSVIGFIVGWFVASTHRQRVLDSQGDVMPNSTFVAWHGHRVTTQRATQIIGVVVLLLAIFTVVQNTRTAQHLNDVADCQARFNAKFAEVSTLRSQLADNDRKALQDMLLALYQQRDDDPKARLRTFERWVETVERSEQQRRLHPLPELPSGECR